MKKPPFSAEKGIARGAATLSAGSFGAKLLGALYRIPLTNILGGAGLGLYQMVFPVYCILLDFAGAGLPCGLSKLVAENAAAGEHRKNRVLLKTALTAMALLGAAASLAMAAFSRPLARAQGDILAANAYVFLAPAVFFVALLSCLRGYFQGYARMAPTALSQIAEQAVKLVFGLLLARLLMPDAAAAAAGAAAAVTLSEIAALILLCALYRRAGKRGMFGGEGSAGEMFSSRAALKTLLKICLPVTLVGVLLPLSQAADSFLILNLVGRYSENATSLYGLFSGGVMTVVNLPVSLCYGIAAAAVPYVSGGKAKSAFALWLTLALSAAAGGACFLLPRFAVHTLFFSLSAAEKEIAVNLLKLLAPSVVTMSLLQTANALLVAEGRAYAPLFGMGLGVAAKIALEIVLLPNAALHVYGAAISLNVCYLVAVLFNLLYSIKVSKRRRAAKESVYENQERFARKCKADRR